MRTALPDGPRGILPGGALLSFPRTPDAFLGVARKYGDLASFHVGSQTILLVSHPDLVREAIVTKHDSFVKGWAPAAGHTVLGRSLNTVDGAAHRAQRRLVLPAFHRARLQEYANAFIREGLALRERWRAGVEFDALEALREATLRSVGWTLFGIDLSDDLARLEEATQATLGRFSPRMHAFAVPLRALRFRSTAKIAAVRDDFRSFADALIDRRAAAPGGDVISMMLAAADENGAPVERERVRDEIIDFIIAGHETAAVALTWVWKLLARHPAAQARLGEELDGVLPGRDLAPDDWKRLPYTIGVVAEALRLYPPQWMMGRRAIEPVEIGGIALQEGTLVLVCMPVLHRDARWFDEPEAFRPERWADGVERSARPFTYLPFGVGPRRCIGEGFAWMEMTLLLAAVASRFRVKPRLEPMEAEAMLLQTPRSGRMVFEERMKEER